MVQESKQMSGKTDSFHLIMLLGISLTEMKINPTLLELST